MIADSATLRPFVHTSQNHAFKLLLDIQHHSFATHYFFSLHCKQVMCNNQDTPIILQHSSVIFTDTAIKAIVLRRHTKAEPSVLRKSP